MSMAHLTPGATAPSAQHDERRPLLWLGAAGLAAIWLAVLLISLFAPDLVSGSQQEHVALPAILTWIWGLIASRALLGLLMAQRAHPERARDLAIVVGIVAVVWGVAAVVAIYAPQMLTGSDPTRLPLAAILAPIVAMVLTNTVCQFFPSLYEGGDAPPKA